MPFFRPRDLLLVNSSPNAPTNPMHGESPQPAGNAPRESRGAKRKRATREKLVEAAFRLMAEHGMDAVAINQITEAADVGFGSFYNHFESKEAIYAAVNEQVFEEFADMLDRLAQDVDDPAEVVAASIRLAVLRARHEPLWGRFLLREGVSLRTLSHGLGVRLLRDIQRGVDNGRFQLVDPLMSFVMAGAGVLGAVAIEVDPDAARSPQAAQFGLDAQNVPERIAAIALYNLGLPIDEARQIAQRPLPVMKG